MAATGTYDSAHLCTSAASVAMHLKAAPPSKFRRRHEKSPSRGLEEMK